MPRFKAAYKDLKDLNKSCRDSYRDLRKGYKTEMYIIAAVVGVALFLIGRFVIGKITIEDDEETNEEENA